MDSVLKRKWTPWAELKTQVEGQCLSILMKKCCRTFWNLRDSHQGGKNTNNWVQYALWFRKRAGKSWPLVSRSNYEVMAKHFSSRVCLAPSVDRPAAFSVCWHRASLTLMTHCGLHRLSCHPAGSVESDLFKSWRQAACQCVPLRRGRQSHFQMFVWSDTCKNTFQWSNLAIWFCR